MCTLIALHRCEGETPLWVAANRDEYYERPAAGPSLRMTPVGPVVAPTDLREGGTWLGVSPGGLFAALTNRPTARKDPSRRSRGLLVLDALAEPTAGAAAERFAALPEGAYNPFNLFLADGTEAFVVVFEDRPRLVPLEPGPHVIGNVDPDDRADPKVKRLLQEAEAVAGLPVRDRLDALASLCRSHDGKGGPLADTCIHTAAYGTRSSTLMRLSGDPARDRLHHAHGAPCETPYEDLSPLLAELVATTELPSEELVARRTS